jgi:hypothetical protein
VTDDRQAWELFRNPLPPATEPEVIFGHMRNAIDMPRDRFVCELPYSQIPDEDGFVRSYFETKYCRRKTASASSSATILSSAGVAGELPVRPKHKHLRWLLSGAGHRSIRACWLGE